jgi:hypothetical protein
LDQTKGALDIRQLDIADVEVVEEPREVVVHTLEAGFEWV